MTTPTFTPPPPSPSRADAPSLFISRANAFAAWIVTFVAEMVAAVGWLVGTTTQVASDAATASDAASTAAIAAAAGINATQLAATSNSSLSLTPGAKTIRLAETGKTVVEGDRWLLIRRSEPNTRMTVKVTGWDGVDDITGTVAAGDISVQGSTGPFTDWLAYNEVFAGAAASTADVEAGTSDLMAITPAALAPVLEEMRSQALINALIF